ncbi:WxL domain-containing protein [Companilactobacillus metriopterae]|uniref:WxL domain-containing protein n=1 Tax=Companilactobacillus metriopterae TaxID=1909267 RepID=UPI00100A5E69|nr:WxL domain-containing protein [Companilactobacillus metriopterae]
MRKTLLTTSILSVAVLGSIVAPTAVLADTEGSTTATASLQGGDLALVSVPNFKFVPGTAGLADRVTAEEISDPIKVSNPGNIEGWTLTVNGTPFINDLDKTTEIKGGVFNLSAGTVAATSENGVTEGPTATEVANMSDKTSHTILSATANNGIGEYTDTFTNDQAILKYPAGNTAGSYTSTLTWTLVNGVTA